MNDILTKIQDYPTVIQGAIGSALAAFLIWVLQQTYLVSRRVVSRISPRYRRNVKIDRMLRLRALCSRNAEERHFTIVALIYRGGRSFLHAILVLVIGLLLSSSIPILGKIASIVAAFLIVRTLNIYTPSKAPVDCEQQIEQLESEVEDLDSEIQKRRSGK